jgi:phosphinothricin acetyltransferase
MPTAVHVRPARDDDLPALTAIYDHYVRTSHVTFDLDTVASEGRWRSLAGRTHGSHRLFVAATDDRVAGYASSGPYRSRPAYATTVETSVYVAPAAIGRGVGASLYAALFRALAREDLHRAVAGIAQPNDASVALHRRFQFVRAAHFSEQGRKFDRYWDVDWYERPLPGAS